MTIRRRATIRPRLGSSERLTRDQRDLFFNPFGEFACWEKPPITYGDRVVFADEAEAKAAWEHHRDELLEEYQAAFPGKEPWPCVMWDAERTHAA